jgi:hypothetical protein
MKAPEFDLPAVDGKRYGPITARGEKGLLVMFLCNNCTYVKRTSEHIIRDCANLAPRCNGSIEVLSNTATR